MILSNLIIQCKNDIENRQPKIVLIYNDNTLYWIRHIVCPYINEVFDEEERNSVRYGRFAREFKQFWYIQKAVETIIVGTLGTVCKGFEIYIE